MRAAAHWNLISIISLLAALATPAYAGWGRAKLIGRNADFGAIAVDLAGTSHVIYGGGRLKNPSLFYTTYSATRARGPSVSLPLRFLDQPSIAVDSSGAPHVALVSNPLEGVSTLIYLSLSGSQWQQQTVTNDSVAGGPQLAIDALDNPHVAYFESPENLLEHAFFDGSQWQIEDTNSSAYPTSMRIAKDGTVHVAGVTGSQVCEERGLNGVWNGECFDSYFGNQAFVGFQADGSPEIAYIGPGNQSIELASFDGTSWSSVPVVEAGTLGLYVIDNISFATDTQGLGSLFFSGDGPKQNTIFYAHQQGDGSWPVTDLGGNKFVNFLSLAISLDPANLPHLVFDLSTPVAGAEAYGSERLPGFTAQWAGIATASKSDKTTITGNLQVRNFGTAAGNGLTIDYYLSTDDQLDSGDTLIERAPLGLEAGQQKTVKFLYVTSAPVAGEYLIAAIASAKPQAEADNSNNVAAGQIP